MPPLREIISMCEGKENNEIFFSRETYTRGFIIVFGGSEVRYELENIVIDLIIVNRFRICPVIFSFKEKRVFHVNICVIVCDFYFGLLILVIIFFGTQ